MSETQLTQPSDDEVVTELTAGKLRRFADWPDLRLERGPPGIYSIWANETFLYVGIAYKDARDTDNPQAGGVWGRLGVHSRARRTSDLMVAIGDRFVIPDLSLADLAELGAGQLDLAERMRTWFKTHVCYRVSTTGSEQARQLEQQIRSNGLPGAGQPLFNAK